jgi:hypothetical protein
MPQKRAKSGAPMYTVKAQVDEEAERFMQIGIAFGEQGPKKNGVFITIDALPLKFNGNLYLFPVEE